MGYILGIHASQATTPPKKERQVLDIDKATPGVWQPIETARSSEKFVTIGAHINHNPHSRQCEGRKLGKRTPASLFSR